jgi:tartrate-resistant acid phosphatase type 5
MKVEPAPVASFPWNALGSGAFQKFIYQLRFYSLGCFAFFFSLIALPAAQLTVGIIGDYGAAYSGAVGTSNELSVANLVKSWNPDFIITTGDNNYPNGEASTIDTNIGQFYHEFIYPYVGAYGAGASSNRFFPCIGNHDWPMGVSYLAPYLAYLSLPNNERYYSFRAGPVEFFATVSDQQEPDGATPTSTQALWLSNALATSTAPWRVVYFHESPYSSGILHGSYTHQADNMLWPFTEWGATAIFAGHNHLYERIYTNSLNYITIGLGGDRIDGFYSPVLAGSLVRYNATYGAGRLTITETNFLSQFINISNQVIDAWSLEAMPAQLALHWTDGQPRVELRGSPGRNYIIQAASDLTDWVAISTNTAVAGGTDVLDPGFINQPGRFYRAITGR